MWHTGGLVEFAGRGGSADLGHTADLSIVNADKKCRADLLRMCTRGVIHAADPMRGCLEMSIFIPSIYSLDCSYAVLLTADSVWG